MLNSKILKVCRKNNKPRLWIEGDFLLSNGWVKGDKYNLIKYSDYLALQKNPGGHKKVSGRDRNNKHIPIIDIVGKDVSMLDEFQNITIFFIDLETIVIKGVGNDFQQVTDDDEVGVFLAVTK